MKNGFQNLIAWQKAIDLTGAIYKATKPFPEEEKYGLVSQMRRSAVSIPSNIAEGSKRTTGKDFNSFLAIALGSTAELMTQIIIAERLGYIKKVDYEAVASLTAELEKIIIGLQKSLSRKL